QQAQRPLREGGNLMGGGGGCLKFKSADIGGCTRRAGETGAALVGGEHAGPGAGIDGGTAHEQGLGLGRAAVVRQRAEQWGDSQKIGGVGAVDGARWSVLDEAVLGVERGVVENVVAIRWRCGAVAGKEGVDQGCRAAIVEETATLSGCGVAGDGGVRE